MKRLLTATCIFAPAIAAADIAERHVERFAETYALAPGEGVSFSRGCASGALISAGWSHDNPNGATVEGHYPQPQFGPDHWRFNLRNKTGAAVTGRFNMHLWCGGPPPTSAAPKAAPRSTSVDRLFFSRTVHEAQDIDGKLVPVRDLFLTDEAVTLQTRLTFAPPGEEHDSAAADASAETGQMVFETYRHRDGTQPRNTSEVYVSDLDGSNPVRLTTNEVLDDQPRWCGSASAFVIFIRDGAVWRMDAVDADGDGQGDNAAELHAPGADEEVFEADCDPAAGRLALITKRADNRRELSVLDLGTGAETGLSGAVILNQSPRWSPDGALILFASDRKAAPTADHELYTVQPVDSDGDGVGDGLTQITTAAPASVDNGEWSPDGGSIFLTRREGGANTLHVIDVAAPLMTPPLPLTPPQAFAEDWE